MQRVYKYVRRELNHAMHVPLVAGVLVINSFTMDNNGVYICQVLLNVAGRGSIRYQVGSSVVTVGGSYACSYTCSNACSVLKLTIYYKECVCISQEAKSIFDCACRSTIYRILYRTV